MGETAILAQAQDFLLKSKIGIFLSVFDLLKAHSQECTTGEREKTAKNEPFGAR
jgi:hypothetical protein